MPTLSEELQRIGLVKVKCEDEIVASLKAELHGKRQNLYRNQKLDFPFKRKSSKPKILEVEKVLKLKGKNTPEYIVLKILKEKGELTHQEIVKEFLEVSNRLKKDSIKTCTTKIAKIAPEIVAKIKVEDILKFKYISNIVNGDLDATYTEYFNKEKDWIVCQKNNKSLVKKNKSSFGTLPDFTPNTPGGEFEIIDQLKKEIEGLKEKNTLFLNYVKKFIIESKGITEEELKILNL